MRHFAYMKEGDFTGVREVEQTFRNLEKYSILSKDPLQNMKYICVAGIAIATRIAIEAGLEEQFCYNISDFYCSKIDRCTSIESVQNTYVDMLALFTNEIKKQKEENLQYSEVVRNAMSYIYNHMHDPIRIGDIAEELFINENYLSTLFKKETGTTILQYIVNQKIEIAKDLLKYSEFSISEISNYLAFSSQSHFNRIFKKTTGLTPRQYKTEEYNKK